jgi:hypothetical protein
MSCMINKVEIEFACYEHCIVLYSPDCADRLREKKSPK